MTPNEIAAQLDRLVRKFRYGCGNAGCQIWQPIGTHTNGSCTCQPARFAGRLMDLARECEKQGQAWASKREASP